MPITTLREISMLQFMNSVTDKPEWDKKVTLPVLSHSA